MCASSSSSKHTGHMSSVAVRFPWLPLSEEQPPCCRLLALERNEVEEPARDSAGDFSGFGVEERPSIFMSAYALKQSIINHHIFSRRGTKTKACAAFCLKNIKIKELISKENFQFSALGNDLVLIASKNANEKEELGKIQLVLK